MIRTKLCDICGQELPPSCFLGYVCLDTPLHKSHPYEGSSDARVTLSPSLNNSGGALCDVCPDCLLAISERMVKRVKYIIKRNASAMREWKKNGVSRKSDLAQQK